ncbi:Maebl [Actinophytocola xinjiangensis]|uniref:Maebl n=1 Tax=Actinophytocola xinjiangensis TaxID=485602 RepID=A0A7Z1AW48_9PSEU|nr:NYN domain-containing protein [Actinophytocola xinjiangensis]OLF06066.1 Maebl [Actinophytocola xinjiangensis]
MSGGSRLAVLIDAASTPPDVVGGLFAEIARYGTAQVRRAYGDWTGPDLGHWTGQLLERAIQPVQQFVHDADRNATDAAMVIDAMDLLHSQRFDAFCVVTSDGDLTRLAGRLRESGLTVYGFGDRSTPRAFVVACDRFVRTEGLRRPRRLDVDGAVADRLRAAVDATAGSDGWASLATIGNTILDTSPDFDARDYGHVKLSDLLAATGLFDLDRRSPGDGKPDVVHVRHRQAAQHPAPRVVFRS